MKKILTMVMMATMIVSSFSMSFADNNTITSSAMPIVDVGNYNCYSEITNLDEISQETKDKFNIDLFETDFKVDFYFWKLNKETNQYDEYIPESFSLLNQIYPRFSNGDEFAGANLARPFEPNHKITVPILGMYRKGLGSMTTEGLVELAEEWDIPINELMYDIDSYLIPSNSFGSCTVQERKHSFYYEGIENDTLYDKQEPDEPDYFDTHSKLLNGDERNMDILHFDNYVVPAINGYYFEPILISWKQNTIHIIFSYDELILSDIPPTQPLIQEEKVVSPTPIPTPEPKQTPIVTPEPEPVVKLLLLGLIGLLSLLFVIYKNKKTLIECYDQNKNLIEKVSYRCCRYDENKDVIYANKNDLPKDTISFKANTNTQKAIKKECIKPLVEETDSILKISK